MAELAVGVSPLALVPGDPDAVDRLAARLTVFADGMGDAGSRLGDLDAAGWRGPAADAFAGLLDEQPAKFRDAGSAFGEAATALRAYTAVLRRAQADAARAVTLFEDAGRESDRWRSERSAYDDQVRSAGEAGDPPPTGPGPAASDPGGAGRDAGRRLLADARDEVLAQGRATANALDAAAGRAPDEPGLLDRVMGGIGDFFGGVWEGLKGIADTLVMLGELSTIRMLIDPEGWARDVKDLASGLWWGITHPVEFFKVAIDWETWKTNPLRAFGKLIPDLAIAAATAGTGTAATAAGRGARAADLATDAAAAARTADRLADAADAGRTADRLGDAADTNLPDPGEWPRMPDPDQRPSWQDSERAVEDLYGPHGYEPQRSFKDGDEVPYGTEGSTRPELYREGTSIEVKNYNCETAGGRHRLQENLVEQATHRRDMLPEGTVQHVIVDVRGQTLNLRHLVALAERIELKSGGAVLAENIQFIR